jgi:transketolase
MRNAFADELTQLAAADDRIVLLSGDIGNRLFDRFKQNNPSRFYNCGVAEANMTSLAAGMAMCGLKPITYTIAPFNTTRCLEQIRDDICYHQVPVLIVGTGSGLSYASLGCTHHSCEDIAMLRSLPNMTILCPADTMELRSLLRLALQLSGPAYMRIGKTGEPVLHPSIPALEIGKGYRMRAGKDLCLLSTGNMLAAALETAALLEKNDLSAEVVSFHTVKPLDIDLLQSLFQRFPLIATMEEHSLIGGFGSAVAEWAADHGPRTSQLVRFGTPDRFPHPVGSQKYLRASYGLTAADMAKQLQQQIKRPASCVH